MRDGGKIMIIQLSSGIGSPVECEYAVARIYELLEKEYSGMQLISKRESKERGCFTSITFSTERDLSFLEGSIQWICESPFRPNHKRKNWFIDVSVIPEIEMICQDNDIRIEKFHCGGKGGQNVNKVESGIRIIHIPTGIVVSSTEERSQYLNKKRALEKLNIILKEQEKSSLAKQANNAWREHSQIVRGNPVRVYKGKDFKLFCKN